MFKITPVQNQESADKILSALNMDKKDGAFIYAMTDCETGALMGASQFELSDEFGYIYDLKETEGLNDFEAMFILGRQTMNFINQCGITVCRADLSAADEKLIKAIGFKKQNEFYECDMTGFFDGSHCSGHK